MLFRFYLQLDEVSGELGGIGERWRSINASLFHGGSSDKDQSFAILGSGLHGQLPNMARIMNTKESRGTIRDRFHVPDYIERSECQRESVEVAPNGT